jgi:poly(beta-D-mannuronate) lyase
MQCRRTITDALIICLLCGVACRCRVAASVRVIPVASHTELKAALSQPGPGDEIVIKDGEYSDWDINIACSGTASNRIVIRSETAGRVVLSGNSRMRIGGDYVTARGLCFRNGSADGEIWRMAGSYGRITDCALIDYKNGGRKWIRIELSKQNRIDHCAIMGKTETDVTLQIDVSESEALNHHYIDHNYFGRRPRGTGNGWETIRNGYSHQQNNPAHNIFEHNLFHECDGENEIISSKSSHNIYRYNTFRNCAGELTLRHGKYNIVQGNFFLGEGKGGSAGIRIIGEGHRVVNNYIENTRGIGIQIYEGQDNAQATGYQAGNDVLVAFNTIINNRGNGINVKNYERTPRNMIIANNLVVGNARAVSALSDGQLADSYSFYGNIAWENAIGIAVPHAAFRTADPLLIRDANGVLRPSINSPVIGTAADGYMNFGFDVDIDLDGQKRPAAKDVGADQVNGAGDVINRPLDIADVGKFTGPTWMRIGPALYSSEAAARPR